jgi:hypothetical protein
MLKTVTWQQLNERLAAQAAGPEQQQLVVVLEVLTEEQQLQEQSSSDAPQQPAARWVVVAVVAVARVAWGSCTSSPTRMACIHQHAASDTPLPCCAAIHCRPLPEQLPLQLDPVQRFALEVVRTPLAQLDRDAAERWRQQGAVVAVWNSGHHSCLATAIRLSAVWRLGDAVVLVE